MVKISFVDHVYLEALISLNAKYEKTLTNMSVKHGPHRFGAAFIDTYEKVCLKDDGDLSEEIIQKKFMYRLRLRLNDYTIEKVLDEVTFLTKYAADKLGGQYTNKINDLLQSIYVKFIRKNFGSRKMVAELKKIKTIIDVVESFDRLENQLELLAD